MTTAPRLSPLRFGAAYYLEYQPRPDLDRDLDLIPDLITLNSAMRRLSAVERRVLHLRFVDDLPQAKIGRLVGVSQMQVSRILARVLGELRDEMEPAAA